MIHRRLLRTFRVKRISLITKQIRPIVLEVLRFGHIPKLKPEIISLSDLEKKFGGIIFSMWNFFRRVRTILVHQLGRSFSIDRQTQIDILSIYIKITFCRISIPISYKVETKFMRT